MSAPPNDKPVKITPEMIAAGCEELRWYDEGDLSSKVVAEIYRAMHEASGSPRAVTAFEAPEHHECEREGRGTQRSRK